MYFPFSRFFATMSLEAHPPTNTSAPFVGDDALGVPIGCADKQYAPSAPVIVTRLFLLGIYLTECEISIVGDDALGVPTGCAGRQYVFDWPEIVTRFFMLGIVLAVRKNFHVIARSIATWQSVSLVGADWR